MGVLLVVRDPNQELRSALESRDLLLKYVWIEESRRVSRCIADVVGSSTRFR